MIIHKFKKKNKKKLNLSLFGLARQICNLIVKLGITIQSKLNKIMNLNYQTI
jgi:hypothetical protein